MRFKKKTTSSVHFLALTLRAYRERWSIRKIILLHVLTQPEFHSCHVYRNNSSQHILVIDPPPCYRLRWKLHCIRVEKRSTRQTERNVITERSAGIPRGHLIAMKANCQSARQRLINHLAVMNICHLIISQRGSYNHARGAWQKPVLFKVAHCREGADNCDCFRNFLLSRAFYNHVQKHCYWHTLKGYTAENRSLAGYCTAHMSYIWL